MLYVDILLLLDLNKEMWIYLVFGFSCLYKKIVSEHLNCLYILRWLVLYKLYKFLYWFKTEQLKGK